MDKKTLTELDFYRIRDEISAFCVSEESAFVMKNLEPSGNPDEIKMRKSLSSEWAKFLSSNRPLPLESWPQIYNILKSMKVQGFQADIKEIYALGRFCKSVSKVKNAVFESEDEFSLKSLPLLCGKMPSLDSAENEIFKIITNDGELRDLPELRVVREKIASLNQKIKGIMHSFTSNQKYSAILESNVPVLRGGRQVLAVKSGKRSSIPGIIHEVSQTGQTVFIEPEESVICSNELLEAEAELDSLIRKILLSLTEKLRPFISDFLSSLKIMEKLDIALASSRWGKELNCVWALDSENENEPLFILKARHPLLREKAVPIDVRFVEGKRVLIITGSNTGGKTVTLKTIALFAMLNQTGFPIPADEGTRLPFFTKIYADIGDDQNLDESLSTFSGHMKNIAKAIMNADENTLVLLDELGSGTDPEEGAAISMAVLDKLIEKKSFVLITTHQGVIKNYGYTHSECINASVEFNDESLSPTYHLLMGVPGESHALEIAKKSGLPNEIVSKAKEYIVSEKTNVSALIKGLTEKHLELDKSLSEIEEKENSLSEKLFKIEKRTNELDKRELELKQGYQKESEEFLRESRKKLENLVRVLKEGEVTREKTLGVRKYISDLENAVQKNEEALEKEDERVFLSDLKIQEEEKKRVSHKKTKAKKRLSNSEALKNAVPFTKEGAKINATDKASYKTNEIFPSFKVGADVIDKKTKREGTIVSSEGKGKWGVQFGAIKITMRETDLTLASKKNANPSVSYEVSSDSAGSEKPLFELRLLGLRAEEAIRALEHQIDLCVIHNFKSFSVIHGKGTGVLQQAVQDYLSNCSSVKDFKFAPPEDGGFGKTYVTLW